MDLGAAAKNIAIVVVPILTILGVGSRVTILGIGTRKHRLRSDIRENLAILKELDENGVFREHEALKKWLPEKIISDVAELSEKPLTFTKKPIEWGSVALAVLIGLPFGLWTSFLNRKGFDWLSIFPGLGAFLMGIAILGLLTNRKVAPDSRE